MSRFSPRSITLGLLFAIAPGLYAVETSSTEITDDSKLEEAMGGLVDGLKPLAKSLKDPEQNAASLGFISAMQAHTHAAKVLSPTNLDEFKGEARAAHLLAYRADMTRLLRELCEMEIEICEGKNEDALARIRGGLIPLRNASHEKYQPK